MNFEGCFSPDTRNLLAAVQLCNESGILPTPREAYELARVHPVVGIFALVTLEENGLVQREHRAAGHVLRSKVTRNY
jgi:hypothetical protein